VTVDPTDTTGALVGNTILELVRDPERLAALQAGPSRVPGVIEESLRFWAPFYFVLRETTREVAIGGTTIPSAITAILPYLHRFELKKDEALQLAGSQFFQGDRRIPLVAKQLVAS
jgi:hypothetical protein